MLDRLAAQQKTAAHPDADLLTAYAENVLTTREREGVMSHLALCRECREVVLLAAPPFVAAEPAASAPAGRRWFALPAMRWVAAAVAVAVVGAGVTLRHSFAPAPAARQTAAVQQGPAPAAQPQATQPVTGLAENSPATAQSVEAENEVLASRLYTDKTLAPAPAKQNAGPAKKNKSQDQRQTFDRLDQFAKLERADTRTHALQNSPAAQAGKFSRFENSVALPASGTVSNTQLSAALQAPSAPPLHNAPLKADAVTVSPNVTSTRVSDNTAAETTAPPPSSSDAVAYSAAPAPVASESLPKARRPAIPADTAGTLRTRAEAPAAIAGLEPKVTTNPTPTVVCSLITDGVRCSHNNQRSELHQPDAKLKVIAAHDATVWAGGDTLLRSDDGGSTWKDVAKPTNEPITQIVVMADAVYVRSASGAMWKSTDNGATWSRSAEK